MESAPPLSEHEPGSLTAPAAGAQLWGPAHAVAADYSGASNLALAFLVLPRDKRTDMNVFYTFCRLVDDIADSGELPPAEKTALLAAWRGAINPSPDNAAPVAGQPPLLRDQLEALIAKYRLPRAHFLDIIAGVEMDLSGRPYATFAELRVYCHRVASVVGLISIEIFGCREAGSRQYALDLGLALQLTNIIRDVGVDLDNGGRIYLPLEDLERFGYSAADLHARIYDARFRALLEFEAQRAQGFYESALRARPAWDRRALAAAEIMRVIYWRLLQRMRRGGFRVFGRRYRLSKPHKLALVLGTYLRSRCAFLERRS
jgi:phytoene synthase